MGVGNKLVELVDLKSESGDVGDVVVAADSVRVVDGEEATSSVVIPTSTTDYRGEAWI